MSAPSNLTTPVKHTYLNTPAKRKLAFERLKGTISSRIREKEMEKQLALREKRKRLAEKARAQAIAEIKEIMDESQESIRYTFETLTNRQLKELVLWLPKTKEAIRQSVVAQID